MAMFNLKKHRTAGWCAAMRCKDTAKGITDLPGEPGVQLCTRHLSEAAHHGSMRSAGIEPVESTFDNEGVAQNTAAMVASVNGEAPVVQPLPEGVPVATEAPADQRTELATIEHDLRDVLVDVRTYAIESQDDVDFAKTCIEQAAEQWQDLEAKRTSATAPMNKALKEINSWFRPAQSLLKDVQALWKQKLLDFTVAQQAAARQLEAQAQAAAAAGDMSGVRTALVAAASAAPDLAGMATVETTRWRVVDAEAVPRAYLTVDAGKVEAAVRAGLAVPGIETYVETSLRRTGK